MLKRGLALACVLGMASVAQAGDSQTIDLRAPASANPFNPAGTYNPGEELTVDIYVTQVAGSERLLRLVHLHFDNTNAWLGLGALEWDSDSLTHYHDTSRGPAAPGDPAGVASAYFYENPADLGPNPARQLILPAADDVRVATLAVTLPMAPGDYTLDVLTAASSVSYGFDIAADGNTPITFWRGGTADLTGGLTVLTVTDVVTAWEWRSIGFHGSGVGEVGLEIKPNPAPFSEPRVSGINKLVVSYAGAFDPTTATAAAVSLVGNDLSGAVDVSGIAIATNAFAGDTKLEITFTPKLQDFAKYRITLTGVETPGGLAIGGTNEVTVTALLGDANGDRRVFPSDVGGVSSLVGVNPIDPTIVFHVRSDANNDGRIFPSDVGGVSSKVGNNAIGIPDP